MYRIEPQRQPPVISVGESDSDDILEKLACKDKSGRPKRSRLAFKYHDVIGRAYSEATKIARSRASRDRLDGYLKFREIRIEEFLKQSGLEADWMTESVHVKLYYSCSWPKKR